MLEDQGLSLVWLSIHTGIDFWRLFLIVEMQSQPMTVADAISIADALDVELPCLIYGTEAVAA